MPRRLLVTGVDGFVGSHFVNWVLTRTDWEIVGVGSTKMQWSMYFNRLDAALKGLSQEQWARFERFSWDLTQPVTPALREQLFRRPIDAIVNLASDSQVSRSVENPGLCWHNNCALIFNLLELARVNPVDMFVQLSSDEVYGDVAETSPGHPEWDTILPSNPYSASKAAQEALAIAYWRSYNVPVVLANTMNIIGEWQPQARFVPQALNRISKGERVSLIMERSGEGTTRRTWLDVKNLAAALTYICDRVVVRQDGRPQSRPERFHIVGQQELSVQALAVKLADKLGLPLLTQWVQHVRPGHDCRYAMQDIRLREHGFIPPFTLDETLDRIIAWARETGNWLV